MLINSNVPDHYYNTVYIFLSSQKGPQTIMQQLNTQKQYLINQNYDNFCESVVQLIKTKKYEFILYNAYYALKSLNSPAKYIQIFIQESKRYQPSQFLIDFLFDAACYLELISCIKESYLIIQHGVSIQQRLFNKQQVSSVKALVLGMQGLIKVSKAMKMLDDKKIEQQDLDQFQQQFLNLSMPQNSNEIFDKNNLDFDLKMAKQCNTVYSETSLSKNILSQNKDAKVFMPVFQCYSEEDLIFIVVRGTEKMLTDGITDSQFQPLFCLIDGFNEPIHEGWFKAAVYVFRQVQQIIQFAWRNKMISKIVLTGHSYGAAVVSIISMFFKSYIPDLNQYCVTFGCPPHLGSRLCLKTFGKHYVNEDDPVCRYSKFYIKQEAIQKIVPKQFIDGQLSEWIEQSDYSSSTDLWIPGNILQIKNEVITPITRYQVNIPNIDFNKGDNHKISAYIKVLHNISLQK